MDAIFYQTIAKLKQERSPFSVATVISVRGSTSAKPGSKAIISQEGKNLVGWIGGGCAEKFICDQSLETLKTGQTKIVEADLDDEIFGLGMPCGGVMQVFIEPFLQPLEIGLTCQSTDLEKAAFLAPRFQMEIHDHAPTPLNPHLENFFTKSIESLSSFQRIFLEFAIRRSLHFFPTEPLKSLKETKGLGHFHSTTSKSTMTASHLASVHAHCSHSALTGSPELHNTSSKINLVLLGHSRISEEIAQLAGLLKWNVSVYSNQFQHDSAEGVKEKHFAPTSDKDMQGSPYSDHVQLKSIDWSHPDFDFPTNCYVLVASHHKGDPEFIQAALNKKAKYIGLIASAKRSTLVFEDLIQKGVSTEELGTIHAPAGLDIQCTTPAQIALSVLAEMLILQMQTQSLKKI